MSKHWNPGKKTVELKPAPRPSRIRRAPVAINGPTAAKPRPTYSRERELFFGIVGMLIFAACIGAAIIAFSIYTVFRDDPEADARATRFSQCYNAQGANCVLDGGTIYVAGSRVQIAGIEAPRIGEAECPAEHDRGIEAATLLAEILNSGPVTIGAPFRDEIGRTVSKVEVKGRDVAMKMIGEDAAHETGSGLTYCH